MSKFKVAIYKPVSDITRAVVEIEAATEEAALENALAMDHSNLDFDWVACADNSEPVWAEAFGKEEK